MLIIQIKYHNPHPPAFYLQNYTIHSMHYCKYLPLYYAYRENPMMKIIPDCYCTLLFSQSNLFSGTFPENFASLPSEQDQVHNFVYFSF